MYGFHLLMSVVASTALFICLVTGRFVKSAAAMLLVYIATAAGFIEAQSQAEECARQPYHNNLG